MPQVSFAAPSPCPSFLRLLKRLLPSLPPTVRDVDVAPPFQERFILTGYRPSGQPWRRYALSLFQKHNQTLNVWSHLLAAVAMAMRFTVFAILQEGVGLASGTVLHLTQHIRFCSGGFAGSVCRTVATLLILSGGVEPTHHNPKDRGLIWGVLGFQLQGLEGQGVSVDVSSLPLVLYVFSAITYLCCSAAAHLMQSHSEQVYYSLYFLDCVGGAIFQYGWALALYLYSASYAWTQSMLGQIFLPVIAMLSWLSCAASCYAKLHVRQLCPCHRKLCQLVPMAATYLLGFSPVVHRLATYSWRRSPALLLHLLQVVLFLLSAFFFSCPVPECFAPGRFDIVGHSHQLSHFLLSLCMLAQQEALFHDFLWRRPAPLRAFGEERLLLASASFPAVMLGGAATVLAMRRRAQAQIMTSKDIKGGR